MTITQTTDDGNEREVGGGRGSEVGGRRSEVGGVSIVQGNKATISLNLLLILAVWVKCSLPIPSAIAFHMDVCRDGGAAAWWLNVRTHNTEVVSSSPVGVTIKCHW